MKKEKETIDKDYGESSNKKLDEIIKQSKLENEALKKILSGLEKLELENETQKEKTAKKKKLK